MPAPINCPVCGIDGTSVANEIIAIALKEQPSPLMLRPRSLVPPPFAEVTPANAEVETWRKRAFDAERRADQAQAAARASMAPHLAQMLRETVVQELATQRRELLKAQEEATLEIASMIRRFDSVQAPLQERLRSYETRIQELEKELSALSEENRELLKLKIEMIRHQLEVERVHNRIAFTPN